MPRIMNTVLIASLAFGLQIVPAHAVEFGVFGDVSLNTSDADDDKTDFAVGGLDFYATHAISDKTRGFIEYVFENTGDGLVTDLERVWISHTFDDKLTFAAGRFHTPLGSWNRNYHHGVLLQDTVSRPFFLDFEDGDAGVLPVHIVGLMATGDFTFSSSEISYELAVANGPSINTSAGFNPDFDNKPEIEINDVSDPNNNKAVVLRVIYKPDAIPLKTGFFAMNSIVAESSSSSAIAGVTAGDDLVTQSIFGADVRYEGDSFDFLAEYYNFYNENEVGASGNNTATAYYVQMGYQVSQSFKTVIRYEDLSFEDDDTYFSLLGTKEATHGVFALRYDVDELNALKFEVNNASVKNDESFTTYRLQWAFLIP